MTFDSTPGSQTGLRQANRHRVVEALRSQGTLTQAEIARRTGLSAASVSNIVRDLRAAGAVAVRTTSANGRRARAVSLVRSPGVLAAVVFEPDCIEVALADSGMRILARERIGYDTGADAARGVRRGAWLLETVLGQARIDRGSVAAAVASVPGPVDPRTGVVGAPSCMPSWSGTAPAAELHARLGVPVVAENDANLAAVAERAAGETRGCDHSLYVRLANGVGAGMIVGGRLVRGAGGSAGELGHVSLDERGPVCRCGNRGCLETLAGAPSLVTMVPGGTTTMEGLIAAAESGDPGCRRIVAEAGAALGRGIAMVVTVFNPERVVVGGELTATGELLLEPLRRALQLSGLGSAVAELAVVPGRLEAAEAPLRGALRLAQEQADVAG